MQHGSEDTSTGADPQTAPLETFDVFLTDHMPALILDSTGLPDFLTAFANFVALRFSDADGELYCGMTLLQDRRPASAAFSDSRAHLLDELQHTLGAGPCIAAAQNQEAVQIMDLGAEFRWPEYVRAARAHGVGSLAALPVDLQADGRAAVNLYSERADRFDEDTVLLVQEFIARAANSLRLAARFFSHASDAQDLKAALQSRTVIDLAVGIIMGQNHCSQQEAFTILRSASGRRNLKLRELAAGIVSSVGGTAAETHFDN